MLLIVVITNLPLASFVIANLTTKIDALREAMLSVVRVRNTMLLFCYLKIVILSNVTRFIAVKIAVFKKTVLTNLQSHCYRLLMPNVDILKIAMLSYKLKLSLSFELGKENKV